MSPSKGLEEAVMRKIDMLIAGFLLTPLGAHAQSCEAIKDNDKANYCRATTTNDKSFCQKIGSGDTLNLCMAKLENDIKYCRRIATEKIKKRCENSILR
jgi:hypothetical protein